jgi:hypothetical protein
MGASSGLTVGLYGGIDNTSGGQYHKIKWLSNDKPFAHHGDSGSLVLYADENGLTPLGLHTYGIDPKIGEDGEDGHSYATPIDVCLQKLVQILGERVQVCNPNTCCDSSVMAGRGNEFPRDRPTVPEHTICSNEAETPTLEISPGLCERQE